MLEKAWVQASTKSQLALLAFHLQRRNRLSKIVMDQKGLYRSMAVHHNHVCKLEFSPGKWVSCSTRLQKRTASQPNAKMTSASPKHQGSMKTCWQSQPCEPSILDKGARHARAISGRDLQFPQTSTKKEVQQVDPKKPGRAQRSKHRDARPDARGSDVERLGRERENMLAWKPPTQQAAQHHQEKDAPVP